MGSPSHTTGRAAGAVCCCRPRSRLLGARCRCFWPWTRARPLWWYFWAAGVVGSRVPEAPDAWSRDIAGPAQVYHSDANINTLSLPSPADVTPIIESMRVL